MSKKSRAKRKKETERKRQLLEKENAPKQLSGLRSFLPSVTKGLVRDAIHQFGSEKRKEIPEEQKDSPPKKNVENALASFNLPTQEYPEIKSGIIYFAEAFNHREHPYVIIRAFRNYDYSKKKRGSRKEKELTLAEKYEKASERGSAVWRPTLTGDAWEVRVKGKATSGVFEKFPGVPNCEQALEILLHELQ